MRLLGLLCAILVAAPGWGQLNNRVFEDRMTVSPADSGKLYFGVNTLGYFKNNEYKQTIIEGYTLFGYQFQPFLSYHLTPRIRLDAGVFLQKDFGNDAYSTTAPIISLKWRNKDFSIIFGNLEGSLNHRLIEPLYNFERVMNRRLETGVQFLIDREDLFADVWLDWQYMQYWKDSKQEQLVGGVSLQKRIARLGSGELLLPVQMVMRHQGGQLDTAGLPIQTVVNTAVGISWIQPLDGRLTELALNGYYVYDKDISKTRQPYLDGDGIYVNGSITTRFGLQIMASYWKAREYLAIEGGPIYQSISTQDGVTLQPSPHLLLLRFLYTYPVTGDLTLSIRYQPYYDFAFKTFQYSYGFYINYRARYFLANSRR